MISYSLPSFLNGVVSGVSISLLVVSIFFLRIVGPLDGIMGITVTEIRFTILVSGLALATTIAYEVYRKKEYKIKDRT